MKRRILTGLALLVAAGSTILFNGCSVIGLGLGAAIDAGKPSQQRSLAVWKVLGVKPGTQITIVLRDGNQIKGKFVGLERVPEEDYAEKYAKCQEQDLEEVVLPELGEHITFTIMNTEKELKREFFGFDYDALWLKVDGAVEPGPVHFNNISKVVDNRGNVLDVEKARKLMSEGKIPLLSAIVIQSEAARREVAMENVYQIQVQIKKHGKLTGFLVGAAIDAIVLVASYSYSWGSMSLGTW